MLSVICGSHLLLRYQDAWGLETTPGMALKAGFLSSVLEGLTEIPFPREDALCMTLATDIVLQHQSGSTKVIASIFATNIPAQQTT